MSQETSIPDDLVAIITIRVPARLVAQLDQWRVRQVDGPSRPQAMLRLMERGIIEEMRRVEAAE